MFVKKLLTFWVIRIICQRERREGALLLPAEKVFKFVQFWANPQDAACLHWNLRKFVGACCRKEEGAEPLPYGET